MSEPMLTALGRATVDDSALPFLELVADADRLRELVRSQTLPLLASRGIEVVAVRVDDVTYTPGHRCVVLCSLLTPQGVDAAIHRAVVTMARHDRLAAVLSRTYSSRPPGSSVFLPEFDTLIELFPADYALPTLVEAASPDHVSPLLHQLADLGNVQRPLHIETLHYRPHRRCVLAYQLDGENESGRAMVGKLYRPGPEAGEAWSRLEFAHTHLTPHGIAVPRPFPLIERLNLLVMERVAGTLLSRRLQEQSPLDVRHDTVSLAARLLASLHSIGAGGGDARTIAGELGTLHKRAAPLTTVAPGFARRVHALVDRVDRRASSCAPGTACFIHGDFTPSQLLLTRDSAALLDFDLAGPGDPAIDVANFTTKLRRRARRTGDDDSRSLVTTFIREYQRHARADDSLARRVQVLESIALVRTAIRAFRHAPFPTSDRTSPLLPELYLDEAEASLSEVQGPRFATF